MAASSEVRGAVAGWVEGVRRNRTYLKYRLACWSGWDMGVSLSYIPVEVMGVVLEWAEELKVALGCPE